MATFAAGLRMPFARYWLSGFLTGNVIVAAAMLLISSGAWAPFNMTAVTMRRRQVPAALLGRVSSLFGIVTRGAEALGVVVGGALAATAGIRALMLAGAPPLAVAVVALAWRHRRSRTGTVPA